MPWRPMMLRENRVLARCQASGDLSVSGGKVEIRYRPGSTKAYFASPRNLSPAPDSELFPDDHCAEAEPVAATDGAGGRRRRGGSASRAKGPTSVAEPPTAPRDTEVLVYADGACSGNPGPAGLGVVMMWDAEERELSEYLGTGTNNIAELTAILRAAEAVADPARPVHIYTDSSYSIGVLTRGWKAKANVDLVATVKRALARLDDVQLFHVRGHAGVELNERADVLAREALEHRGSSGWRVPSS